MQDPIQKTTKAKRAGGVTQVIECLALRPNTSTTKKCKIHEDMDMDFTFHYFLGFKMWYPLHLAYIRHLIAE
jgi:hypothetical protein